MRYKIHGAFWLMLHKVHKKYSCFSSLVQLQSSLRSCYLTLTYCWSLTVVGHSHFCFQNVFFEGGIVLASRCLFWSHSIGWRLLLKRKLSWSVALSSNYLSHYISILDYWVIEIVLDQKSCRFFFYIMTNLNKVFCLSSSPSVIFGHVCNCSQMCYKD